MSNIELKKQIKAFIEFWKDKGYEKGQSQQFWTDLLEHVLNVPNARDYIEFEKQAKIDTANGFIDAYIPSTKVLIEQKGAKVDLKKEIKQSDGSYLDPFRQAKRYIVDLPLEKHPRWVITCNFKEFLIYDMNKPTSEPEKILLSNLDKEYYRLEFIIDKDKEHIKKEQEVSIKAGVLVGNLYDALLKQYNEKDEKELKSLNELCVRLVFCLYAEDSGLFGHKLAFHDYLKSFDLRHSKDALRDLFKVLDTKIEDRDRYLDPELAKFPYVNGGLFANEDIIIPHLTEDILDVLLYKASENFDWSDISPTIFGAVFESTLNPETRRSGGMHYTTIENIHKVIDPLFLDELKDELNNIKEIKVDKIRKQQLELFKLKLSKLKFLDPACGSGNFLTETYISLRRLENEALKLDIEWNKKQANGQIVLGFDDTIKVSISQFYGIEINDFAVTVAKTALWISEAQMMQETESIVNRALEFFPLKSYPNIIQENALEFDWNQLIDKTELNYIIGNPPFIGSSKLNDKQKQDRLNIFKSDCGELDYVACWYKKSSDYIFNTNIRCAFVSTNSICQGQQVCPLWKPLFNKGIVINFAHTSFDWKSDSTKSASVVCVIIGFSYINNLHKKLITDGSVKIVKNINAYLLPADNVFVEKVRQPICKEAPIVIKGLQPTDNGYLILNDEEKNQFILEDKRAERWIRPFITAKEFVEGKNRWCLWLKNISPVELNSIKPIRQRVELCKKWREQQTVSGDAYKLKNIPTQMRPSAKFKEDAFIVLPRHTTSNRAYVPFGYVCNGSIPGDSISLMPNADIYCFGILESNVHMAWMRAICGRLGNEYRYTSDIVYNTFPWPTPTDKQRNEIRRTAQLILDARNKYPECSLSILYDDVSIPPELSKAHELNDKAVMEAYGFKGKINSEEEIVSHLMKMYSDLIKKD